ncbi:MAG: hypothetical protein M3063_08500 [Actinomycetota bacterium]|nr:hypothetical protein [Actinomycetota bacterium]MDQ6945633.1 hypothetical protein [Actinomycetota bacterium]
MAHQPTREAYNALAAIAQAAGIDVILVAEILGHSVDTARRSAPPFPPGSP